MGGKEEVYNECKPILDVLGKESCYVGPSGSGATMKLCVNTLLGLAVCVGDVNGRKILAALNDPIHQFL